MREALATKTVHVRIEGLVQGVCYRAWTAENARELGLNGWVRNRRDGAVEAVFSGDHAAVDAILLRCQGGPRDAVVASVTVVSEGGAVPEGFSVRPTA